MRVIPFIITLFTCSISIGQTSECDTIYLKDGKKIAAVIQSETSTSYKYILCCEECSEIRTIKKKDVDWKKFTDSTWENLKGEKDKSKVDLDQTVLSQSFLSLSLEVGGPGMMGGAFIELLPIERIGFRLGIGLRTIGSGTPLLHSSVLLKLGKNKRFVPSIGFSKLRGYTTTQLSVFTNFYSFQKNTKFGYLRLSPGWMMLTNFKYYEPIPWLGISIGFNLLNNKKG